MKMTIWMIYIEFSLDNPFGTFLECEIVRSDVQSPHWNCHSAPFGVIGAADAT